MTIKQAIKTLIFEAYEENEPFNQSDCDAAEYFEDWTNKDIIKKMTAYYGAAELENQIKMVLEEQENN